MTGKRPMLIGVGIGLIISSMLLAIISFSGSFTPAAAQKPQETGRDTDKTVTGLKDKNNPETGLNDSNNSENGFKESDSSETESKKQNTPVSGNLNENKSENKSGVNSMTTVTVEIPPGFTAQAIVKILLNQGLIADEKVFLEKVKELDVAGKFKAGEFELEKEQNIDQLIDRLLQLP